LAASNILLAVLIDQILDWDSNEDGNLDIQLGALIEEFDSGTARATTGVDSLVAAGELCLITALGLCLLHSHVVWDLEAHIGVSLVIDSIAIANATSRLRKSSDCSSNAEKSE